MKMIKEKEVKFVDFAYGHPCKEQHVSVPVKAFTMDKFETDILRRLLDRGVEEHRSLDSC